MKKFRWRDRQQTFIFHLLLDIIYVCDFLEGVGTAPLNAGAFCFLYLFTKV